MVIYDFTAFFISIKLNPFVFIAVDKDVVLNFGSSVSIVCYIFKIRFIYRVLWISHDKIYVPKNHF